MAQNQGEVSVVIGHRRKAWTLLAKARILEYDLKSQLEQDNADLADLC